MGNTVEMAGGCDIYYLLPWDYFKIELAWQSYTSKSYFEAVNFLSFVFKFVNIKLQADN